MIYRSTRDSRVMVPRPPKKWDVLFRQSGWTLNFGNRRSYLILLGLLSVPVGFLLLFVLLRFSK